MVIVADCIAICQATHAACNARAAHAIAAYGHAGERIGAQRAAEHTAALDPCRLFAPMISARVPVAQRVGVCTDAAVGGIAFALLYINFLASSIVINAMRDSFH